MSKRKRTSRGKEFCGAHTTCTEATKMLLEILDTIPSVTKFSPGPIAMGGSSSCKCWRLKIGFGYRGMFSCIVNGGVAVQQVFVYTRNIQETKLLLARKARDGGYSIRFEKEEECRCRVEE